MPVSRVITVLAQEMDDAALERAAARLAGLDADPDEERLFVSVAAGLRSYLRERQAQRAEGA